MEDYVSMEAVQGKRGEKSLKVFKRWYRACGRRTFKAMTVGRVARWQGPCAGTTRILSDEVVLCLRCINV